MPAVGKVRQILPRGPGWEIALHYLVLVPGLIARQDLAPRRKAIVVMVVGTMSQAQSLVQLMPMASAVEYAVTLMVKKVA